MLNVLRNRTISEQLYALAGIVFLGFALVVGLWAQTRAAQDRAFDAHMGELADLRDAVGLDFALLKARYYEKEFLIRPDKKISGRHGPGTRTDRSNLGRWPDCQRER